MNDIVICLYEMSILYIMPLYMYPVFKKMFNTMFIFNITQES